MIAMEVEGGTSVARGDGRQPNQLRPLGCEVGVMARADGAARFSHGDSTVLATVTGPADISASREESDRATIEVIWRAKSGSVSSIKDRRKEQQLVHVLDALIIKELHPRSSITLVVQEINDDGAVSIHHRRRGDGETGRHGLVDAGTFDLRLSPFGCLFEKRRLQPQSAPSPRLPVSRLSVSLKRALSHGGMPMPLPLLTPPARPISTYPRANRARQLCMPQIPHGKRGECVADTLQQPLSSQDLDGA